MGVTIAAPPKAPKHAEPKEGAKEKESEEAAEPEEERPMKDFEVWFQSEAKPYIHRLTNPSGRPLHMVAIEVIKSIEFLPGQRPFFPAVGTVELENERVRVVRYTLDPGQSVPDHVHNFPVFLVALGPGQVADACRPDMHDSVQAAGFLCVTSGPPDHKITNAGYEPLSLLEFEIRQSW
jgi:quercetin dioxygenase-like cupin family protein